MGISREIELLRLDISSRMEELRKQRNDREWDRIIEQRRDLGNRLAQLEERVGKLERKCPGVYKVSCPHTNCTDPTHVTPLKEHK